MLDVIGYLLSVISYRLSVIGYRLSVVGYLLSVIGSKSCEHFSIDTDFYHLIVCLNTFQTTNEYRYVQMNSYHDLQVYTLAFQLAKEVHFLSLKLPKFELFESGSQIRRSAQSIRANIVEGYGRKRYKKDFIHFLTQAYGSCLETKSHLTMLDELYPHFGFDLLIEKYDNLGSKIHGFINYVEKSWLSITDNR
jgi:four helix bundle protein